MRGQYVIGMTTGVKCTKSGRGSSNEGICDGGLVGHAKVKRLCEGENR